MILISILFDATDLKNILCLSNISIMITAIWKTEIFHIVSIDRSLLIIEKFYEDQFIKITIYTWYTRYLYKHAICSIHILLVRSNNDHVAKVYVGDVVLLLHFCKTPTFLWRLSDLRYSAVASSLWINKRLEQLHNVYSTSLTTLLKRSWVIERLIN